jgi:hypothetical protein
MVTMALADVLRQFSTPEPPRTPGEGTAKTDRTPSEGVLAVLSVTPQGVEGGPALASRVRQILLAGERHTALSLALRLGRPRDRALYQVLSDLLTARAIATDGASCEFYRRETP